MNTKIHNQFFYLSDPQSEFHDVNTCGCDCAQPYSDPHTVVKVLLYELDVPGLQALDAALMGGDDYDPYEYGGSFDQWLDKHFAKTYCGLNKDATVEEAIQQARNDGKLIINHPEEFPWIFPLACLLGTVVGDGAVYSGYMAKEVCECNSTHTHERTVCYACYARLVSRILHTFIYAHLPSRLIHARLCKEIDYGKYLLACQNKDDQN